MTEVELRASLGDMGFTLVSYRQEGFERLHPDSDMYRRIEGLYRAHSHVSGPSGQNVSVLLAEATPERLLSEARALMERRQSTAVRMHAGLQSAAGPAPKPQTEKDAVNA